MCFVIRKDCPPMTAWEIVIYGRSGNTLAGLLQSDFKFLDVPKRILTFAKMFVLEHVFHFTEGKTE